MELFRSTAEQIFEDLPEQFRRAMANVVIVVEEFAATDVLAGLDIVSPWGLLGLYEGHPMIERESGDSGMLPDMIHLYRQPILAEAAASGISAEACIRETLIHEIGHYFGFSDAQMAVFEAQSMQGGGKE